MNSGMGVNLYDAEKCGYHATVVDVVGPWLVSMRVV